MKISIVNGDEKNLLILVKEITLIYIFIININRKYNNPE